MGSKHASVHLRYKDREAILAALKKEFHKKTGPSKKDMAFLGLIKAMSSRNIEEIEDPEERASKGALLDGILRNAEADMGGGDPAVIVVREQFISIYWYDRIRVDNLNEMLMELAGKCDTPALGVSVFDDTNFTIMAVRDAGRDLARKCWGEYMFDYDDIRPVSPAELCEVLDAPFFLDALEDTLSREDGEEMAEAFERGTGLAVMLWPEECAEQGMTELYQWKNATVFCA